MTETAWWASLQGDDIRLNTEGNPPYDAARVAVLIMGRLGMGGRVLDVLIMGRLGMGGRVLDVGCGTGRLTAVYDILSGSEVVGFDPSPQILTQARSLHPGLSFTDELPDGPFKGAYSVTVFQHLTACVCRSLIGSVMARLRPGGRFCFQYVEGTEDTFLSHQTDEATVRSWCTNYTVIAVDRDPEFEDWRWVTLQR